MNLTCGLPGFGGFGTTYTSSGSKNTDFSFLCIRAISRKSSLISCGYLLPNVLVNFISDVYAVRFFDSILKTFSASLLQGFTNIHFIFFLFSSFCKYKNCNYPARYPTKESHSDSSTAST